MSSKSNAQQSTNQTDNRRVIGEGAISAESGATVNYSVLDNGAIGKAFDFSGKSLDFSRQVAEGALKFGLDSQASSASVIANAYNDAKGRGALTDYILIGAIAMAGIVAYSAVSK